MLTFFVSGSQAKSMSGWSNAQVKTHIHNVLSKYLPSPVTVLSVKMTNWQNDPFTLGGFSYAKVGTTSNHFWRLSTKIRKRNNYVWFAGEHTHDDWWSYTQGAYKTGVNAA